MAVAALLPLALLAVAILFYLANSQQEEARRATTETVRALTVAVDNELERTQAGLRVLVESDTLMAGDLAAFRAEAQRVMPHFPTWSNLILADRQGQQIVNLRLAPGTPLGGVVDPARHERAVRTGRPVIGGIIEGRRGGKLFSVRVPVVVAGAVKYVLTAACSPDAMVALLREQNLPPDGVVSVLDSDGRHVARSRDHANRVGEPPSPSLQAMMKNRMEGWGANTGLEQQGLYSAFRTSPTSGWSVALGIPRQAVDGPFLKAYFALGLAVLLSIALGIAAALLAARAIIVPVSALRDAARALGRGAPCPAVVSSLPEIREVADALRVAQEERAQVLEREREARLLAEHTNRAKDELLAMLGHELRNPMGAISAGIAVLEKKTAADDPARRILEMLARQCRHLARLTDDLLDVGRVIAGKVSLAIDTVDLAELAGAVVATARAAGQLDEHVVKVDAQPACVNADPARMEQVIGNLLRNALKYTPAGGAIGVEVRRERGLATLSVRDEGCGIAPELLPCIFDLFAQGPQPADRGKGGLGIGLTLVRRLVALHGGTVVAACAGPGQGSEFKVSLPAVTSAARRAAPPGVVATAARRILLVEDNADARTTMRLLLESQGHTVLEAHDGPGGIEMALACAPHVALVDIGLPGCDGYAVAREIRAQAGGAIRLVALTGYGQDGDRRRAEEAGFDVHLVKPVEAAAIAAVLAAPTKPLSSAA